MNLAQGAHADVFFLLGQAESIEAARALVKKYQTAQQVDDALDQTRRWWEKVLGAVQVHTPLLSVDLLLNRWLLYQSLSCRFWGRSALYQSSGAFGFRDQLQDAMGFVYGAPELTRAHILASAARQFPEGDVQHWWHADTGQGIRTHCSDDLLWLPFVTARYIEATGDHGILEEHTPFVEGPLPKEGEPDQLFIPAVSHQTAPLWEHCQRAIDHAMKFGSHGLPLIGSGDWNDGLNLVGVQGRGESIWLGWFFYRVLEEFALLMEQRPGGGAMAGHWRARAAAIAEAVEQSSWDGEWYLRCFFDNGDALGSHKDEEAKIDSLPQSWAVISGAAEPGRARQAMEAADRMLVDESGKLVRLFTPPFDHSKPNPGYIMGYPPGLRENGGQYTHGSQWMALAWARLGEGARAVRLLKLMNPVELSRTPEDVARYRGEPYVVAADVSSAPGMVGRCGWTWYTGSSAWMYRIWVEEVLGFRLSGNTLRIRPAIPEDWPGFEITYRYRGTRYEIAVVRRGEGDGGGVEAEEDGRVLEGGAIALKDDGATHRVTVRIPKAAAKAAAAEPRTEALNHTSNGTPAGAGATIGLLSHS